jgi:NAD(P)-dependent dehydrogenase (short-subunit alcohol dehydrogenase family)
MALMSQAGRGHVVTVTSSLVDQPMSSVPGVLTSLTRGALNAATRALAIEHAKNGVRVNAVSAGIIKTPMHSPEIHPFFASLHPIRAILGPAPTRREIAFLTSGDGTVHGRHRSRAPLAHDL